MIRAVLDTNVLVSAILSVKGLPRQIFERWRKGEFQLVTALPLLDELDRVLRYPKIREEYRLTETDIHAALLLLSTSAEIVTPLPEIKVIPQDLADNFILACAVAGKADYIVSGDRHLLDLQKFGDVRIARVQEFIQILGSEP